MPPWFQAAETNDGGTASATQSCGEHARYTCWTDDAQKQVDGTTVCLERTRKE